MEALQVFKSGATSTVTTLVIGLMRGSLISPRMIPASSRRTSPLIRVFLILFFSLTWYLHHRICLDDIKLCDIVKALKHKTTLVACFYFFYIVLKAL